MASDVMSLFGMNPNVIQQNRVQGGVDQASRMSADYAIGAAGGQMLGAGINSAFGLQTPDMQQASNVQQGMSGADLTTPAGLRAAAQKLMMSGDYPQAMALHARARELEATGTEATRATEDRALGKPRNVIVRAASTDALGATIPAISHSITEYPDGRVSDATVGKEFNSFAEWMAGVRGSAVADPKKGDSNVTGLSPSEALETTQDGIDSAVASLEEQLLFTNDEDLQNDILKQIENVKAGDPTGSEKEIKTLKSEAADLFNELRSGNLQSYELQQKSIRLQQLKAQLDTLGVSARELSQLSKVTP
tara:strand:- start:302 stop:1222 length:921 start_codon:yes stop_codon:yes gene_type:complete